MHEWRDSLLRGFLRAPVLLYRAGGGRLLGHRFLLLTHQGRRTGREHRTVLEVVLWRADVKEAVVLSGWGRRAQWYRNIRAGGAASVQIAGERFAVEARVLEPDEAAETLAAYERANWLVAPVVRRVLARLSRVPYDGSAEARLRLVDALPMVALRARR
jgi:deazaflavin-dependent oxidoreductase (nitroreductase family)